MSGGEGETIRILMVEDSPADAALIERALRQAGLDFRLERVTTLDACSRALGGARPDLVICDHNIPPFQGADVLELVRAVPEPPPFILITGSLDEVTAVEYMKAGAADYILKDRLARLGSAVRVTLQRDADRRARERAQADKRDAEARLGMLLRATNDAVWDFDLINGTLEVNEGFRSLVGLNSRSGLTLAEWHAYIHEEDRPRVATGLESVLDSRASFWTDQYRLRRPDGSHGVVTDRALVMRDPSGRAIRVVGAMVDDTEKQKLQHQLQQSQKMEAVGRLAGGIAHDFNNVLTTILISAHLLQSEDLGSDAVRAEGEAIKGAAERAAALTRQLLAFSRKQVINLRNVDLSECIQGVAGMLRRIIGEHIELRLRLSERVGVVRADAGQLEQILLNLAVNARDAMPDGGVLTIETHNVDIDEAHAREHVDVSTGPYVRLTVSDTGTGMDAKTRERIFEPFFTTKGSERGTGLGLSTAYGIVRQHGGGIAVYSEPGHGTTFRIHLPRVEGEPEPAAPGPSAHDGRLDGTETILLVEDEEVVRKLTRRILERYGYTVLAAEDADDARRLVVEHRERIDLLIADIVMPGTNGPALAREFAADGLATPVLFLSGYSADFAADSGFLSPGSHFLSKPFTPPALAAMVREAISR